ncbi:MAG: response regulator [Candidatus Wallbacteria bacterium]|nr:response regulator [Candidatus Wallbacteria bacterium]
MRIKTFTTFDISRILEVNPNTVTRWINAGKLKSFITPGGHNRVLAKDLLAFLKEYNLPVPVTLTCEKEIKILVVDDDEIILKTFKQVLEKNGYAVYLAKDGFQAGDALNDFEPQLVVLDILLPGINGFAVCKAIKGKYKKTKILGITGHYSEESKNKLMAAGAADLLAKPITNDDLLKKVDSLLNDDNLPISGSLNDLGKIKILVVDDDESVLKIIKLILEENGYQVKLAADGFQAGKAIGEFEPQLVILDIMLPGISGFDVCKLIREKYKTTKILGITGQYTAEIRKKIIACGADDLIEKQFNVDDLVEKVGSLLKSQ